MISVKELFLDALECAPENRAAFLAEVCAGNLSLKSEVESLLAAYENSGDSLSTPNFELGAASVAAEALETDDQRTGKRIGAYRIVREIGRGGMGTVYLAVRDDQQYEQRVAIKLIKGGMDTDQIARHFRRERQILANLRHPNIAQLHDGGMTDDDSPFFVMEYIEGSPINEYADARNLSLEERLKLFCSVCEAVAYAHQNQVIHRDIKPGNILITEDGTPKLLDFGIAKLLNLNDSVPSNEPTVTALRVMTPEYASPEQLRGSTLAPSSDVYSLGVLLYELLAGISALISSKVACRRKFCKLLKKSNRRSQALPFGKTKPLLPLRQLASIIRHKTIPLLASLKICDASCAATWTILF